MTKTEIKRLIIGIVTAGCYTVGFKIDSSIIGTTLIMIGASMLGYLALTTSEENT